MGHRSTTVRLQIVLLLALGFTGTGMACDLPPLQGNAGSRTLYHLDAGKSLVRFDAKAFMHDFAGKTSQVQGTIRLVDLEHPSDAEACIRIDAASLDSGNSTRDSIMRKKHLETGKYPMIDFSLKQVESVRHESDDWAFQVRAILSLHGVSREIVLPIQARQDGNAVRLIARIPLRMTDYGIRIPKILFFTVEDQVIVSFDVTANRAQ